MKERISIATREIPCPHCGYDLRATARVDGAARCPECGSLSHEMLESRIAWVHRRTLGRVKSYLQTITMVTLRPWTLARETNVRLRRRDGVTFERASLVLGALIGTMLVATAFALTPERLPETTESAYWIMPAFALSDSWWGLVPMAVGFYMGLWIAMGCLRWVWAWGSRRGVTRTGMIRAGYFAAALVPIEALLLGLTFSGVRLLNFDNIVADRLWVFELSENHPLPIFVCSVVLGLSAELLSLWMTWWLVAKIGRWKLVRGIALSLGVPVAAVSVICMVFAAQWVAGYAAMALDSMLH